ncbi:MAG TPA: TadE family protein [Bacillota bacterium]|nr:TadE family protein [Bacillota bacterium]
MQQLHETLIDEEKGSVMVEFALISTVLILLLAGIIQFGLIFNTQLNLENAVREGARFASLPANANNETATETFIRSIAKVPLAGSEISITPAWRQPGDSIQVTIQYRYTVPVTLGVFPETIELTASSVMMQN